MEKDLWLQVSVLVDYMESSRAGQASSDASSHQVEKPRLRIRWSGDTLRSCIANTVEIVGYVLKTPRPFVSASI